MESLDATLAHVPIDFRYRPLVALVSVSGRSVYDTAAENGEMHPDGSWRGCDTVLQKPGRRMDTSGIRIRIRILHWCKYTYPYT
jgi:hypothetical protein